MAAVGDAMALDHLEHQLLQGQPGLVDGPCGGLEAERRPVHRRRVHVHEEQLAAEPWPRALDRPVAPDPVQGVQPVGGPGDPEQPLGEDLLAVDVRTQEGLVCDDRPGGQLDDGLVPGEEPAFVLERGLQPGLAGTRREGPDARRQQGGTDQGVGDLGSVGVEGACLRPLGSREVAVSLHHERREGVAGDPQRRLGPLDHEAAVPRQRPQLGEDVAVARRDQERRPRGGPP